MLYATCEIGVLKWENDSTQALAQETSHFSSLGWGGGIWGNHMFFRGNGRGSRYKRTIRVGGL